MFVGVEESGRSEKTGIGFRKINAKTAIILQKGAGKRLGLRKEDH